MPPPALLRGVLLLLLIGIVGVVVQARVVRPASHSSAIKYLSAVGDRDDCPAEAAAPVELARRAYNQDADPRVRTAERPFQPDQIVLQLLLAPRAELLRAPPSFPA